MGGRADEEEARLAAIEAKLERLLALVERLVEQQELAARTLQEVVQLLDQRTVIDDDD
jgi:hypothetical protein